MALSFDGVDDVTNHGDINALDGIANLSISFWLYYRTLAVNDPFVGKKNSGTGAAGWLAGVDNLTNSQMAFTEGTTWVFYDTPTGSLVINAWAYWGFLIDMSAVSPNKVEIYKDGVSQTITIRKFNVEHTTLTGNAIALRIGGDDITFSDCVLAHTKIWTATLTPAEIFQEMNSYRPIRTSNLVLWSPYDDGTKAVDYSGSGNHGTVTGALAADSPFVGGGVPVRRL